MVAEFSYKLPLLNIVQNGKILYCMGRSCIETTDNSIITIVAFLVVS